MLGTEILKRGQKIIQDAERKGERKGERRLLNAKITELEVQIGNGTAPVWARALDVEYLKVIKELGNGAIHTNGGDVTKQANIDPVLPYDQRAAERHARERARQHRLGVKRPYFDGLIAAVALANDLMLVTANLRDFAHYEGLEVETSAFAPEPPPAYDAPSCAST